MLGISIVDSDLTTDIVEPADFNRYVSNLTLLFIVYTVYMSIVYFFAAFNY